MSVPVTPHVTRLTRNPGSSLIQFSYARLGPVQAQTVGCAPK